MTDGETAPGDATNVDSESQELSTSGLLAGARQRLVRQPQAVLVLVLAGAVVAGIDWVQLHDPVPTTGYEGVQEGRIATTFFVLVTVVSRASVPAPAYVDLKRQWLAAAGGLALVEIVVVTLASGYALSRLLAVDLTPAALGRYGLAIIALRVGVPRADFEGGAAVLAIPLLIAIFVVMVRLVPFPGLLIRGDSFRTALGRSWRLSRGHGWALFGVVLVLGVTNHLLVSVPVVGPVGTGLVAAVHAGVVASVLAQFGLVEPGTVSSTDDRPGESI